MLCKHCKEQRKADERPRPPTGRFPIPSCERCGLPLCALAGSAPGVPTEALARLARFGLGIAGRPLLERQPEDI